MYKFQHYSLENFEHTEENLTKVSTSLSLKLEEMSWKESGSIDSVTVSGSYESLAQSMSESVNFCRRERLFNVDCIY